MNDVKMNFGTIGSAVRIWMEMEMEIKTEMQKAGGDGDGVFSPRIS